MLECPGHFGAIKLAVPVYHYGENHQPSWDHRAYTQTGFLGKVKKLLETVCHNCGKIKAVDVSIWYCRHSCRTVLTHRLLV
jgi:DNA-directed RNA polymerase II subunit RPB1